MSSAMISSLQFASQQVTIYLNSINLFCGVTGNLLNIVVFLSLKTLRENTCGFYLIVISFCNIGQLVNGTMSRILITGLMIDWTMTSLFYCKLRFYLLQTFGITSFTLLSLATIDQYFATCSRPRWQQWSNIKLVRYLSLVAILIWLIVPIPYLVFYQIFVSSSNQTVCADTNPILDHYNSYFSRLILQGFLPNSITAIFGVLAYLNTKNLAYRTVPLVRRELDKQLTSMLLVQVVFNIVTLLLFNIISVVTPSVTAMNNPNITAVVQFIGILSYCFYYAYFACPFYIYICVSERFRRQLIYVLCVKHCPWLRGPRIAVMDGMLTV